MGLSVLSYMPCPCAVNSRGFRGAGWFKSNGFGDIGMGQSPVAVCLGFRRRDITDRRKQPRRVEPGHPFKRRQLDGGSRPPKSAAMDHLRLVQPVDGLDQRVVVAVATTAHGRFDTRRGEALAKGDGAVLRPTVAVVVQEDAIALCTSGVKRVLDCIAILSRVGASAIPGAVHPVFRGGFEA
jgi:hypothetical protein